MSEHHHRSTGRTARKTREPAHDRRVVAERSIAVQLDEVF